LLACVLLAGFLEGAFRCRLLRTWTPLTPRPRCCCRRSCWLRFWFFVVWLLVLLWLLWLLLLLLLLLLLVLLKQERHDRCACQLLRHLFLDLFPDACFHLLELLLLV
jgi:hypothetical protein